MRPFLTWSSAAKQAEAQAQEQQEQAQQQAQSAQKEKIYTFKRDFSACLEGKGYTVKSERPRCTGTRGPIPGSIRRGMCLLAQLSSSQEAAAKIQFEDY